MKKILIIHNKYQNIGGEDIAVENEIEILKKYYKVEVLYFKNDKVLTFKQLISFATNNNSESNNLLKHKILSFKPDLVYIHNTWFKASLGMFKILEKLNIKTFIKLHNFRYICTSTLSSSKHLDGEALCKACGYKKKSIMFLNTYFIESFFKSVLVLVYGKKYFQILKKKRMNLLVLTDFHKNFIKQIGGFKSNIFVFPNPIKFKLNISKIKKDDSILYAGRVSHEKGVDKLIESFLKAELDTTTLKIVGDGPLLNELKNKYSTNEEIQFLGVLSNKAVLDLIENSIAVVTATRLYEGQPTLLCEASSLGVPSIFPKSGGIEEFFPDNYSLSFNQFDYKDLENKIKLISKTSQLKEIGNENKNYIFNYLNEKKLIDSFNMIIDGK
jgi:glycosyltransferase involved in cell wall biosynthesis